MSYRELDGKLVFSLLPETLSDDEAALVETLATEGFLTLFDLFIVLGLSHRKRFYYYIFYARYISLDYNTYLIFIFTRLKYTEQLKA